jgi:DNA-binding XRE family transcriptional regulator
MLPLQLRMARAALNIAPNDVATAADIPLRTVVNFENGLHEPPDDRRNAIQHYLESKGARFVDSAAGVGVLIVKA